MACFVAVVVLVGLIFALELAQWVFLVASTLAAVGASLYVGNGGYGADVRMPPV